MRAGLVDAGGVLRLLRADPGRCEPGGVGTAARALPRRGDRPADRADSARQLVELHRARGDRLVLTTATNRFLTELSAAELGIAELIATELELDGAAFTGRIAGRRTCATASSCGCASGSSTQLLDDAAALAGATFYSDSINDLPLLRAVGHPVVVDPDAALEAHARERGWPMLRLAR